MARVGHLLRASTALAAMAAALIAAVLVSHAPAEAQTATDSLKQPPFEPTDITLFDTVEYSDGPAMAPATSGPTEEDTLRGLLSDLLEQRFPANSRVVSKALALFDSDEAKQIVPDPRLRAALVALKGTAGEPAIAGVLGNYSAVRFGDTVAGGAIAQVDAPPPGGDKPIIAFNQRYQFEDFRLLASIFAHEVVPQDSIQTNKEELIANSIDSLVYGQFVLETPSLATSGTELARFNNTELMARINTRDAHGNLRLFTSTGPDIFPGGNPDPIPYFAAPLEPLGNDTPGNMVLKGELTKVLGKGVKVPRKPNFDNNTALLLDADQGLFTDAEVVQLAEILLLDTSPPSAAQAQRVPEEAEPSDQPLGSRRIFREG